MLSVNSPKSTKQFKTENDMQSMEICSPLKMVSQENQVGLWCWKCSKIYVRKLRNVACACPGNGSLEGTLSIIAIKNEYKDENRVSTIYVDT